MQVHRRPSTLPRLGRPLSGFMRRMRKARSASGATSVDAASDSFVMEASMLRLTVEMTRSSWVLKMALYLCAAAAAGRAV